MRRRARNWACRNRKSRRSRPRRRKRPARWRRPPELIAPHLRDGTGALSNALLTTASTAGYVSFRQNRFLHWLCIAGAAAILISAFRPERVFDWGLENVLVTCCLAALILTYNRFPFSDLSYVLILVFLSFHEWGAHYKYSDVPLGEWMKPWLHTQRNHYDRVIHFSFGLLLSYPMQEVFLRKGRVTE